MDRNKLLHFIKKIISGSASVKEEEAVNREFIDHFVSGQWDQDKMGERENVQDRILKNVNEHLVQPKHRFDARHFIIRLGKVAAVISLISIVAFYGRSIIADRNQNQSEQLTNNLQPGKEKASLTLNDGTVLDLEDLSVGETFKHTDFDIKKTKDGDLEYHYHQSVNNERSKDEWNTLTTPSGGKSRILLSDGTKVWLNAKSTLAFPKNFSGNTRKVKASGEVYFEVSHNEMKPFIVSTKEMDIRVLGTSFNVSNYEDNAYPMVSLLKGAVQVKVGSSVSKLVPGQRASIEHNQMHIGPFDMESEIAWKDDYFLFKNKNIKEIMTTLARWYGAEIEYQGEDWENKNYTIRISRKKNIEEILSIIELTESVKFKVKGRRILVVT